MRKKLEMLVLLLAVSAIGMSSNCFAAVTVPDDLGIIEVPEVKTLTTKIGLGVAAIPDYEGSEDYKAAPVPFVRSQLASGQYLQIAGATLSINVVPSKSFLFGPMVRYRMERNDDVENDQVEVMEEVDAAVECGGFVGYQFNNWMARFEMVQDTANGHGGALSTLTAGYKFPLQASSLGIYLSSTYADEDYMHAYFSVDADNRGLSTLPDYDADAGIKDVAGTLIGNYAIDDKWGLIGLLRYTQLIDDAQDSPLVDDEGSDNQVVVGVVATYTF